MANPDLTDFRAWRRLLRRAIRRSDKNEMPRTYMMPAETPDGVLRVHCYRYYRRLKRAGALDGLVEHLENDESGRWIRHKAKGVDVVLRLLERSNENWFITPSRRGRIARDLNFADHHEIHSKLLLAFLYEHKPPDVGQFAPTSESRAASIALYKRLSEHLRESARKRHAHETDGHEPESAR